MPRPADPHLDLLIAGSAGALAMTIVHEAARQVVPRAPRLDSLGRRALVKAIVAGGMTPPDRTAQQAAALGGDLLFNAGLFGAALALGAPASAPARGALVGAVAGLATLALPPRLGIGPEPAALAPSTRAMTVGLYVGGGLVAGLAYRWRRRGGAGGS